MTFQPQHTSLFAGLHDQDCQPARRRHQDWMPSSLAGFGGTDCHEGEHPFFAFNSVHLSPLDEFSYKPSLWATLSCMIALAPPSQGGSPMGHISTRPQVPLISRSTTFLSPLCQSSWPADTDACPSLCSTIRRSWVSSSPAWAGRCMHGTWRRPRSTGPLPLQPTGSKPL